MKFSVVIPTYKRPDLLTRCLETFEAQTFSADNFEIIVVDDAGNDNSKKTVESFTSKSPLKIRSFAQKNSGAGMARNKGVQEARGEIIVFVGDDIFPAPDFLEWHAKAHASHPKENEAVLGLTLWHPELTVTPLMDFMVKGGALFGKFGGHQFAYDLLDGKTEADYRFFYTSNISLKRSLLMEHPFDPSFSGYGFEDIELGYRLTKEARLKIFYEKNALAYHYHPMDEAGFISRMRHIGNSLRHFDSKYPEIKLLPRGKKKILLNLLTHPLSMRLLKKGEHSSSQNLRNLYYYALSKKYFLEGLQSP